MSIFLLTFFTIYGGAHCYYYRKLVMAHQPTASWRVFTVLLFTGSTLAPIVVRIAERHELVAFAIVLAYPAYVWMAILFLFLVSSSTWDTCRLTKHLWLIIRRRPRRASPQAARRQFISCLGMALLCSAYGLWEAHHIRTEQISLTTPKLRQGEQIRIVQVSDVHLGILAGTKRINAIISAVHAAKPDILVSTGDLIDGLLTHDGEAVRIFRDIAPRLGAYAIPGNHEYYVGYERAAAMMREAGFNVLKGEFRAVGPILIAGADDPTARRGGTFQPLPPSPTDRFTLLLKHQPLISTEIPFDLQLSGHVHKGQIFPFNLVTWLRFRISCGLTTQANGQQIYVSRGTGTWGPPIRFLAPPEVTVIDLLPSGS